MKEGNNIDTRKKRDATDNAETNERLNALYSPSLSFFPTYWLSIMDAAVTTAFITVEH